MIESQRRGDVIKLDLYRAKQPTKESQTELRNDERLLDEITYHILMAARAIASHSKKKQ
jgi:hypothetical protein